MTLIANFRSYLYHKPIFFNLFDEAMVLIEDSSQALIRLTAEKDYEAQRNIYLHINKNKIGVKRIVEALFTELQKNFITPYDRDDILSITIFLRKISDNINAFAKKTLINQTEFTDFEFNPSELLRNFNEICLQLKKIVAGIRDQDGLSDILPIINLTKHDISQVEADIEIYNATLLNDNKTSAKDIVKVIEVFRNLSKALVGCDNAIFTVESIVVKYQ